MNEQPRSGRRLPAPLSVGFTLSQLGFSTSGRFGQLMAGLGLEPRHFAVLRAVGEAGEQSQQAVAQRLQIPASTMVTLLDHLEREGLIERRPHPTDRRTWLPHLTSQGGDILDRAVRLGAQWEEEICSGLSPAERDTLLALLRRVAINIGVATEELPDRGTGQRPQSLAPRSAR
ncbi:MAG: MarR family winged helix-turn-helix transcriptional regulator [Streptosporangiaceae bacterium]